MGGEGMSGGRERRTRGGQRRARKGRAADKRRKARRKRRTSGAQVSDDRQRVPLRAVERAVGRASTHCGIATAQSSRRGEGGGSGAVRSRSRPYDDEKERMLCEPLLDDEWEAVACRYGVGIRSEERA